MTTPLPLPISRQTLGLERKMNGIRVTQHDSTLFEKDNDSKHYTGVSMEL